MDGDGQFKFGVCSTCVFPCSLMETSVNFRTIIQNLLGGMHDNSGLSIDVIHRSDDIFNLCRRIVFTAFVMNCRRNITRLVAIPFGTT